MDFLGFVQVDAKGHELESLIHQQQICLLPKKILIQVQ